MEHVLELQELDTPELSNNHGGGGGHGGGGSNLSVLCGDSSLSLLLCN
jgi:hypothetical protein